MLPTCHPTVLAASLAASGVLAATSARAQQEPRSFVRLEAGRADIHRASSTGAVVALRLGRRVDQAGVVRLDLGATYSGADESYFSLEAGAELRPLTRGALTPVAGIGIGLLVENEFGGEIVRGTAALELEVSPRTALRIGAQVGAHGGARGPNAYFGAVELRIR